MTLAFLQDSPSGKNGTPLNIHVKILNHFASMGNQIYQEVGIQFLDFSSKLYFQSSYFYFYLNPTIYL